MHASRIHTLLEDFDTLRDQSSMSRYETPSEDDYYNILHTIMTCKNEEDSDIWL